LTIILVAMMIKDDDYKIRLQKPRLIAVRMFHLYKYDAQKITHL